MNLTTTLSTELHNQELHKSYSTSSVIMTAKLSQYGQKENDFG